MRGVRERGKGTGEEEREKWIPYGGRGESEARKYRDSSEEGDQSTGDMVEGERDKWRWRKGSECFTRLRADNV
jgi:hypothetical protein